jgi:ferritin
MNKKLYEACNTQINNEWYSAYLYLSMAAYFDSVNLEGFAHWMKVQAKEEFGHGMKFFDFLNDRGMKVVLKAVAQPPATFASAQEVFEKTLEHEKKVTGLINELYALSKETDDPATGVFLQWFITEQVEEEKSASTILETLKAIPKDSAMVLMLDKELAKRE